jgi:hypothetical protein
MAQGKTTAAVRIAQFLQQNPRILRYPMSYRRWLYVEAFEDRETAEMRYEAINTRVWHRGYR